MVFMLCMSSDVHFWHMHRALRKWVDTAEDGKHALLHARCEARAGRLAAALKALDKAATAAMEVPPLHLPPLTCKLELDPGSSRPAQA